MTAGDPHASETLDAIMRERRRRRLIGSMIGLAVLLGGLLGGYLLLREPEPPPPPPVPIAKQPPPAPPKPPEPPPPPPPPPPPEPEPEPVVLPELDESDTFVRALAETLSSRPSVAAWLASDDLVRRFVATVDNIAGGQSPRKQLDMMWPKAKFESVGEIFQEPVLVDQRSYARYDVITEAFVSLDVEGTVALYEQLGPMIEAAYADLGYPDRDFDDAVRAAIRELLAAPVVVGEVTLAPRVISYAYADTDLEDLSAAQKQLLRMGPKNVPRVQRKLREFARAFGIADSTMPRSRIYKVAPLAGD